MARFELSKRARADLDHIADYTTETWGAKRRDAYLDALEACMDRLAERPLIGAQRSDLRPSLRAFHVESHVIFYTPKTYGVIIVRILHKRMDAARQF